MKTSTQMILIRHHQIHLPAAGKGLSTPVLATLMSNISYFGYALSLEAYQQLASSSEDEIRRWWRETEPIFKAITGDDKAMDNFVVYKNFPQEVLTLSLAEYWQKQLFMYWGFPDHWFTEDVVERPPLSEEPRLRTLHLADEHSLPRIYRGLLGLPNRWTEEQWEQVAHLAPQHASVELSTIPFKENMVQLATWMLDRDIAASVGTATDVLRLAIGLSEGDISLRTPSKLRGFKRKERKYLLGLLEACTQLEEDLVRHEEVWKRLMRALRPGDYASRFPRVVAAYDKLYKGTLPQTFSSQLEALLAAKDPAAIALLKTRPGEFVRRLHICLLCFEDAAAEAFVEILPSLKMLQLLKIRRYLETCNKRSYRTFPPKGNWGRMQVVPNDPQRRIKRELRQQLILMLGIEISARLYERVPTVDLDEHTKWIKLQTNDSELTPYGRGTVFPIPQEMRFLRTACYWASDPNNGNVWFDNGWNFFGKDWTPMGACCWNAIEFQSKAAVFSGDPTNSKEMEGRACQMIDLYLDQLAAAGVHYAVWNILCFSRISFNETKEVHAAMQWGQHPQGGKLFEPSRCQLSFPIHGDNWTKYIAYIDIKERQVVYMDANLYADVSSATQNTDKMSTIMPAFVEYLDALPSVYDVFQHQPRDAEGLHVLYSDVGRDLQGKPAYIFRTENQHNSYEPFVLSDLLRE